MCHYISIHTSARVASVLACVSILVCASFLQSRIHAHKYINTYSHTDTHPPSFLVLSVPLYRKEILRTLSLTGP